MLFDQNVFWATIPTANPADANTVRQFAERSGDDGKAGTVIYDFKYVRKK